MVPSYDLNSGTALVQIFFLHTAIRYAFWISHVRISRSFNAAIVRAIRTESLDTTDEYVVEAGAVVVWPPSTSIALRLKFSPSLTSKIIWHLICWYPIGMSSLRFSNTLKAGCTFFIYFMIAYHHKVSPLSLSIRMASSTALGTRIPYLWVLSQYLCIFKMMRSLFSHTNFTHHTKAGSSHILFSTAYSSSWTGYESFISFSLFHVVLPSFYLRFTSQVFVVVTRCWVLLDVVMNASCYSTCVPSVLTYMISSTVLNVFTIHQIGQRYSQQWYSLPMLPYGRPDTWPHKFWYR